MLDPRRSLVGRLARQLAFTGALAAVGALVTFDVLAATEPAEEVSDEQLVEPFEPADSAPPGDVPQQEPPKKPSKKKKKKLPPPDFGSLEGY